MAEFLSILCSDDVEKSRVCSTRLSLNFYVYKNHLLVVLDFLTKKIVIVNGYPGLVKGAPGMFSPIFNQSS